MRKKSAVISNSNENKIELTVEFSGRVCEPRWDDQCEILFLNNLQEM